MGKINSKAKGKRAELQIAHKLKDFGFEEARRTNQFCGNTGDASDVVGLPGIHIEVKHNERLNIYEAIEQAVRDSSKSDNTPVVFHRKNGKDWLCTLQLDNFLGLYCEYLRNKDK